MLVIELLQVSLGVRSELSRVPTVDEWRSIFTLSKRHGIAGVLFGGIEMLPSTQRPPGRILLEWLGVAEYHKRLYNSQRASIEKLIELWSRDHIHTIELKGAAIGKYYPQPELRYSCDFDCFLLKDCGGEFRGAYEQGNEAVERIGIRVNRDFYKNSSFVFRSSVTDKGIYVENHRFCCPVRGNKQMKRLEKTLRGLLIESVHESANPTYHPMSQFQALFLMEHMWAHFFEEALTLKQVCDWLIFRRHCHTEVDWDSFNEEIKACGFYPFAVALNKISDVVLQGDGDVGENIKDNLTVLEVRLWQDILSEDTPIEMNNGWTTRFQLIRNYFRNSWKYRCFAPHGPWSTLLRTSMAYILDRNPRLS